MVSGRPIGGERAQLILVGCVMIAFVVVSSTVVINTNLYTENAAPALSNEQVEDARTFDLETRKGVRSLVHRVNHGERYRAEGDLEENVTDAVASYNTLLAESYARSEPARASVSYNPGASENGYRVVQSDDDDFVDIPDTNLLDSQRAIGWFAINVDVQNTSEDQSGPANIVVNGDTETLEVDIYRNGSANLTVASTLDGATKKTTCDSIRGRVLIDLYEGHLIADECFSGEEIAGINDLEGPYDTIRFREQNEIEGRYEFVVNGRDSLSGFSQCTDSDPSGEACESPAVWTANVTTTYEGDGVDYENDRNVTIYTTE